jgi:ABC-type dipeptide/oligopeptide/nickel transport system ATPase component
MELTLQPNKLHAAEQVISVDNNILTLIGENGCGKSAILESLFRQYLENDEVSLVCFSSGQNESFSDLYLHYIKNSRKVKFEAKSDQLKIDFINSFYFDYDWSKILIFFASALKKDGFTRNLLSSKYLDVDDYNDDISTKLKINLKIDANYVNQIEKSLEIESLTPEDATLRKTNFHTQLGKLIEKKINPEYDFTNRLSKNCV